MRFPHVQGAFRETLVAEAPNASRPTGLTPRGRDGRPFAVTLHATRAGRRLLGNRVLVTGCGPIGTLAILAARSAGAREIVATDCRTHLALAQGRGGPPHHVTDPTPWPPMPDKGTFDVRCESSGIPQRSPGIDALRPRGVIVQLGLGGDVPPADHGAVGKELEMRGSFRFHAEFALAVDLMQKGLIDVKPLITHTVPLAKAEDAFKLASRPEPGHESADRVLGLTPGSRQISA